MRDPAPFLSEPEWTRKVREGCLDEIRPYDKSHEAQPR